MSNNTFDSSYTLVGFRFIEFQNEKDETISGTQVFVIDPEESDTDIQTVPKKFWFTGNKVFKDLRKGSYSFGQNVTITFEVSSSMKLKAVDIL